MFTDAFQLDQPAAHAQQERARAISRSRLQRLAVGATDAAATDTSLVDRIAAALRPAPQPCVAC